MCSVQRLRTLRKAPRAQPHPMCRCDHVQSDVQPAAAIGAAAGGGGGISGGISGGGGVGGVGGVGGAAQRGLTLVRRLAAEWRHPAQRLERVSAVPPLQLKAGVLFALAGGDLRGGGRWAET